MDGGFAPRFLLEAGFLAVLAVVAGLADLETRWIVIVMAAGWLLVTLIELAVWRAEARRPTVMPFVTHPLDAEAEPASEPDGWDIEEILAPLPGDDQGHTEVLPAGEEAEGEIRSG